MKKKQLQIYQMYSPALNKQFPMVKMSKLRSKNAFSIPTTFQGIIILSDTQKNNNENSKIA